MHHFILILPGYITNQRPATSWPNLLERCNGIAKVRVRISSSLDFFQAFFSLRLNIIIYLILNNVVFKENNWYFELG